jgi:hypothetical protein
VLAGGAPAARRLDKTACGDLEDAISLGSFSVLIGGQPAARIGDMTAHGGVISEGVSSVLIGDAVAPSGASRTFATAEEAARAALEEANPRSITANREYGGKIYQDAEGGFHYTAPMPGEERQVDLSSVSAPPGTTVVADYHTHGDYSYDRGADVVRTSDPALDTFDADNFSQKDTKNLDKEGARDRGYRGYLGTPSGAFREYDPNTGSTRNIN